MIDGATGAGAKRIVVSPVGDIDPDLCDAVCRDLQRIFGYAARPLRLLDDVDFAFNLERRQHHSTRILEELARKVPADVLKVVGIVSVDLFIPILTHVFGEAQLGGGACVVSTFRLDDYSREVFVERLRKEAAHELGHTFKLRHCPESYCIMHYCRSIRDVDRKAENLCPYCQVMLEDEKKRLTKTAFRQPR